MYAGDAYPNPLSPQVVSQLLRTMKRPLGRYPTIVTACPPRTEPGSKVSRFPRVPEAPSHVLSMVRPARIGPCPASHDRHWFGSLPRLKYDRMRRWAASAKNEFSLPVNIFVPRWKGRAASVAMPKLRHTSIAVLSDVPASSMNVS